eukprot:4836135-Prymnesium_polylepis.1
MAICSEGGVSSSYAEALVSDPDVNDGTLYWSHPGSNIHDRANYTLHKSNNGGATWDFVNRVYGGVRTPAPPGPSTDRDLTPSDQTTPSTSLDWTRAKPPGLNTFHPHEGRWLGLFGLPHPSRRRHTRPGDDISEDIRPEARDTSTWYTWATNSTKRDVTSRGTRYLGNGLELCE